MIRPRPPHLLHVTCDCANMPGKICCFTIRTPLPPHSGQEWMSPSVAAPEPRQWSHNTRFLIMNWFFWLGKKSQNLVYLFILFMGTRDEGMEVAGRGIRDVRQCLHPCRYLLEKPRTRIRTWGRGGPPVVHGLRCVAKSGCEVESRLNQWMIIYVQPPPKN